MRARLNGLRTKSEWAELSRHRQSLPKASTVQHGQASDHGRPRQACWSHLGSRAGSVVRGNARERSGTLRSGRRASARRWGGGSHDKAEDRPCGCSGVLEAAGQFNMGAAVEAHFAFSRGPIGRPILGALEILSANLSVSREILRSDKQR